MGDLLHMICEGGERSRSFSCEVGRRQGCAGTHDMRLDLNAVDDKKAEVMFSKKERKLYCSNVVIIKFRT